jgi:primosomal protein N''
MSEAIVTALITGGLSLLGVVISNIAAVKKSEQAIRTGQAVTDTKLEELTREVREHNHFARRMPVVEEQIKVINHRISDLEDYHKPGKEVQGWRS